MIRTVIVDDEPIIRMDIAAMLTVHADIEVVGTCGSVPAAIQMITALQPDLLLLDVQLGGSNSFQIINALPDLSCPVIFITAFDNHAIHAIRIGALDYLLKPLDEDELSNALEKVRQKRMNVNKEQIHLSAFNLNGKRSDTGSIALRSHQQVYMAQFSDIIYCEGEGNYTTFHLTGNNKILVSKPLKEYEELLPSRQFIRSHQSFLVNIKQIHHYDREGILYLHNKTKIPVSTRRRDAVLTALTRQ